MLRVGAAMQAMPFAIVVTLIVWRFNPTLRSEALFYYFRLEGVYTQNPYQRVLA